MSIRLGKATSKSLMSRSVGAAARSGPEDDRRQMDGFVSGSGLLSFPSLPHSSHSSKEMGKKEEEECLVSLFLPLVPRRRLSERCKEGGIRGSVRTTRV